MGREITEGHSRRGAGSQSRGGGSRRLRPGDESAGSWGGGDRGEAQRQPAQPGAAGKGWGEGREKRPSAKRAKAAEEKRAWPERQT